LRDLCQHSIGDGSPIWAQVNRHYGNVTILIAFHGKYAYRIGVHEQNVKDSAPLV